MQSSCKPIVRSVLPKLGVASAILAGLAAILVIAHLGFQSWPPNNSPQISYSSGEECDAECCASIPGDAGKFWYWGTRSDQTTYYTRSICYSDLARRNRDQALCRFVRQRHFILADGSYYSPQSCINRIRQDAADSAAPKTDPKDIAVPLDIKKEISGSSMDLILTLNPAKIDGQYALSAAISFDYQPNQDYFAINAGINPTNAPWQQEKYERYHASAYWIFTIRTGQSSLRIPLDLNNHNGSYREQLLQEISHDKPVKATITLQALDFSDGSIAKTESDIGTDYGQHKPYRKRLEVFLNETPCDCGRKNGEHQQRISDPSP